ncbi:2',3'-cyclic-nucleotide 2'-phosphodiesterase/3'-nucleotidase precursor [Candidatus Izimaplasma bacterium HR1]|jgi:2',3'-cyclic-nucleotide 2'-phosphodiesterase/3'-nucleotidase|uniref:bifunctional metallophosphatase/5'-nucleotidase n=1 Tax=Candidatus Izimoplasma sp. HR1 TaxID=1541959 RepID=UPI0004F81CA2|nr:2',3'-cyclic-nucleotide 2'-phosphodiesterase/3'-nucleotidase precursor [Candidatus Izimaplasma bacterium HR1]
MKNIVTFKILHTSDIHGYIYPNSYTTKQEGDFGLAKLSTLIKSVKDEKTILIDSGDTIQGSPLTYYYSKQDQDNANPLANVLNEIGFDYVTIGNHDFNYGKEYLLGYLNHLDAKILNCNLLDIKTKNPFKGITEDIMIIDGVKIGLIGVTTHYIPNWEQPSNIENIDILDAFESTKKQVNSLRDKVDFLIVSYHGGFERDLETNELLTIDTSENQGSKILNEIEGIDLLLTGHQHRSLFGTRNKTIYTQPGYNAQNLAVVVIEYNKDSKSYQVLENKLLDLQNIKADQKVLDLVKEIEDETQKYLDTPVGHIENDLLILDQLDARINKHPIISLINHIQMKYTNADIALCGLANEVSGFRKDISIRDVIGTYVYPNTLVVKKMDGRTLKLALEKTAEFFDLKDGEIVVSDEFNHPKLQLYAYDMYDGIEYTIKVGNKKGERITSLTKNGITINDNDEFSVCMNNYRSSGGGDYFFIKDCEVINDTQTEIIDLLVDYIVETKDIKIPHKDNIKVIK